MRLILNLNLKNMPVDQLLFGPEHHKTKTDEDGRNQEPKPENKKGKEVFSLAQAILNHSDSIYDVGQTKRLRLTRNGENIKIDFLDLNDRLKNNQPEDTKKTKVWMCYLISPEGVIVSSEVRGRSPNEHLGEFGERINDQPIMDLELLKNFLERYSRQ